MGKNNKASQMKISSPQLFKGRPTELGTPSINGWMQDSIQDVLLGRPAPSSDSTESDDPDYVEITGLTSGLQTPRTHMTAAARAVNDGLSPSSIDSDPGSVISDQQIQRFIDATQTFQAINEIAERSRAQSRSQAHARSSIVQRIQDRNATIDAGFGAALIFYNTLETQGPEAATERFTRLMNGQESLPCSEEKYGLDRTDKGYASRASISTQNNEEEPEYVDFF